MSQDTVVTPNAGSAAPAAPGQLNVQPGRRAFRRAGNTSLGAPPAPASLYNKELGAPPLIGMFDGLKESDVRDDTPSTFVPCHINLMATWYLLCQRFASHDRFLKDTSNWHPYMDLLYLAFLQYYFVMLVRKNKGELRQNDLQYVSELEEKYKPHLLHVPGVYVQYFMALTATESPYQWESLIMPGLPQYGNTTANDNTGSTPARAYIPANGYEFVLNPIHIIEVLYQILTHNRANITDPIFTPGVVNNVPYLMVAINNSSFSRHVIDTPLFRVGNPASPRAEDAFWYHNTTNPTRNAATTPSHTLDLPLRPNVGNGVASVSILQFLGLIDPPVVAAGTRTSRLRNWPLYYSNVINFQCQYIPGSRTLNDIALVGIGANSVVWRYTDGIFVIRDPQEANDHDPIGINHWNTERNARYLTSLSAVANVRDPELEQVALQVSAAAQVNVDMSGQANATQNTNIRQGPFWNHSICGSTPAQDPVNQLAAGVPGFVSSVVRK